MHCHLLEICSFTRLLKTELKKFSAFMPESHHIESQKFYFSSSLEEQIAPKEKEKYAQALPQPLYSNAIHSFCSNIINSVLALCLKPYLFSIHIYFILFCALDLLIFNNIIYFNYIKYGTVPDSI